MVKANLGHCGACAMGDRAASRGSSSAQVRAEGLPCPRPTPAPNGTAATLPSRIEAPHIQEILWTCWRAGGLPFSV